MNYENIKETFSKIDFNTLTLIKDILDKEYKHKLNNNIQQSLSSKSKEALIKLIRDNYSECQYHSTIKLNQQYFSEESAEKIFHHFLTNIYQEYYGKHISINDKPQFKHLAILEYGKSGKTTHFHIIHNHLDNFYSANNLLEYAKNFITLSNLKTNNLVVLGKENEFSKQICDEYIRYNTNAILTRAIKKVVKNGDVETKFIADKYHIKNLCDYFTKELDDNHFLYFPEGYFLNN